MSASIMRDVSTRVFTCVVGPSLIGPRAARRVVAAMLFAGVVAGSIIGSHAHGNMGDVELTHLLRAMAILKLAFVIAAASAMMWRLQAPVTRLRLAGYALVSFAMAAGPALIWYLAYVGPAAVLMHVGIASALLLLWYDGTASELIHATVLRRRAVLHANEQRFGRR